MTSREIIVQEPQTEKLIHYKLVDEICSTFRKSFTCFDIIYLFYSLDRLIYGDHSLSLLNIYKSIFSPIHWFSSEQRTTLK